MAMTKLDPVVSAYFSQLVGKRNKKKGKRWLSENAKKAVAAREAKRRLV